jgi:cell division protein FtsI (penicillin-binding protein 3)
MGKIFKNKLKKAKIIAGDDLGIFFKSNKNSTDKILIGPNSLQVSRERLHLAKFFFVLIFSIFIIRSTSLALFPGEVRDIQKSIVSKEIKNPLPEIFDRNNKLLVTSVRTKRASIRNPVNPKETARLIKAVLPAWDEDRLKEKLENRGYVELADNINDIEHYDILNSGVAEVEFHPVWRRIYTNKELASHIIGYSGRDLVGLSGIEKTIPKSKSLHKDIKLSIDITVQFHLENEIRNGIELYSADSGFGVIIDVLSGEIIASASLPTFDPNTINQNYSNSKYKQTTFNQVMQGSYELGSVMKVLTIAMALEDNKINLNDTFDDNICIKIAANRCLNNYNNQSSQEPLTAVDCLVRSSNRCMAQIAQIVGRAKQKSFLQDVGLLDEYFLEIFETGSPILPAKWSDNSMLTISFGQGLGVVPLSFASGIASIVNGGFKIKPTLYSTNVSDRRGASIISEEVSEKVRYAMRQVVKRGSGQGADIKGYAVIGKTGTADIPCNGSYEGCGNRTAFVGAFPGWNPQYVLLVSYERPQANIKKGIKRNSSFWNAGPTAGRIIELIAPLLNVEYNEKKEPLLAFPNQIIETSNKEVL